MHVLIIGGGIGGLCLAHGLRKANIAVTVFERQSGVSDSLAGYGIHINARGRRALHDCLPDPAWRRFLDTSTPAGADVFFRDERLRLLARRDDAAATRRPVPEVERRGIGRLELRDLLLEGLTDPTAPVVRWSKIFKRYEELPSGRVRAHFADGTCAEGDVLVGADASHSAVRTQRLPDIRREDLGIVAIAGRYRLDDERIRDLPEALTDGSPNNVVPAGRGWMFVSIWRSRPADVDGRSQPSAPYVVWAYVVPKPETPLDAGRLGPEALRKIALAGVEGWSPILATLIREADATTLPPIVLRSMPRLVPWRPSRVTLLGDAIHNMTPLGGIGANTALRDAELLGDVLAASVRDGRPVVEAIGDYKAQMRGYANQSVGLSRRNAERASAVASLPRRMFRLILRAAALSRPVMRATIERAAAVAS